MTKILKFLLQISSLFSAILGPLLVTWTGISLKLLPTWSDATVMSASSAFWAGMIQIGIWLLIWVLNIFSQSADIYVSKNTSFDGDGRLVFEFKDDAVKLFFRLEVSGSNKRLSKKKIQLIFPNQVDLQSTSKKEYYSVIDNRVVINLQRVLSGQAKYLQGYKQDFTVFLIQNEKSFQNDLSLEKNYVLLKQNLKTEVRMVSK